MVEPPLKQLSQVDRVWKSHVILNIWRSTSCKNMYSKNNILSKRVDQGWLKRSWEIVCSIDNLAAFCGPAVPCLGLTLFSWSKGVKMVKIKNCHQLRLKAFPRSPRSPVNFTLSILQYSINLSMLTTNSHGFILKRSKLSAFKSTDCYDIKMNSPWLQIIKTCILPRTTSRWAGANPHSLHGVWESPVNIFTARVIRLKCINHHPPT